MSIEYAGVLGSLGTTEELAVFPLQCQRPDGPLNCHVVYAVFTIIPIGKYPVPKVVEVVQDPPNLVGELFYTLGYQVKHLHMHGVYYSIRIFVIAALADRAMVTGMACAVVLNCVLSICLSTFRLI